MERGGCSGLENHSGAERVSILAAEVASHSKGGPERAHRQASGCISNLVTHPARSGSLDRRSSADSPMSSAVVSERHICLALNYLDAKIEVIRAGFVAEIRTPRKGVSRLTETEFLREAA